MEVPLPQFRQWKKQRLEEHIDCSKKGGIDEDIVGLVALINGSRDYFTTSSCSGRHVCYVEDSPMQKKGCVWLMVSHQLVEETALLSSLEKVPLEGNVFFKFEPFVLHVCCRTLHGARAMASAHLTLSIRMQWAVASGFRNSGISIGKSHKIMLAVRSTHSLEAPVAHSGHVIVSEEYLKKLVCLANERMKENSLRIQRFEASVTQELKTTAACEHTQATRISVSHARSRTSHDQDTTSGLELHPMVLTPKHESVACPTHEAHATTDIINELSDFDDLSCLFYQNDS